MQVELADFLRDTQQGKTAESILRKCVHCGFCTATCPTYQLLGNELDGPRGRIYLIKQMVEGDTPTARTQLHLDRCLTCRSCETTCPSGVQYGRLLDIGRELVDDRVDRSSTEKFVRTALQFTVPKPNLTRLGLFMARLGSFGAAEKTQTEDSTKRENPELADSASFPQNDFASGLRPASCQTGNQ